MFFKARSQLFFGISNFFLIHHKLYPQDDHSLKFLVKKVDFQFFFTFFLTILLANFFDNSFYKQIILNGHLEGNAYGEKFFFRNSKQFLDWALKTIVLDVSLYSGPVLESLLP
jgi:hypothetical protein